MCWLCNVLQTKTKFFLSVRLFTRSDLLLTMSLFSIVCSHNWSRNSQSQIHLIRQSNKTVPSSITTYEKTNVSTKLIRHTPLQKHTQQEWQDTLKSTVATSSCDKFYVCVKLTVLFYLIKPYHMAYGNVPMCRRSWQKYSTVAAYTEACVNSIYGKQVLCPNKAICGHSTPESVMTITATVVHLCSYPCTTSHFESINGQDTNNLASKMHRTHYNWRYYSSVPGWTYVIRSQIWTVQVISNINNIYRHYHCHCHHFNNHFQGEPGLSSSYLPLLALDKNTHTHTHL